MPRVPDSFVPQVSQSGGNTPTMPVVTAPNVAPMSNYAPQQLQQFGQTMERSGEIAMRVGAHIQNQLDDANVKAAESKFIEASVSTVSDYMNKQGADALNSYEDASKAITKAKQEVMDSLGNDVQKAMFNRVSQQHLVTFGARMAEHRATQRNIYTKNESLSRAENMRAMVQNSDFGSADHEKYISAGVAEIRNAFKDAGPEAIAKAEREYRTQIVGDDVSRLMTANQYEDAKSLLGEQVKAGNVDPDVANRLRATIEANVEREQTIGKADAIFAPYKNKPLTTDNLESMLKEVEGIKDPEQRKQVESLVKGQFSEQYSIQQAKYRENLNDVVNYKYAHGGSLKGIDPVKWGMLDAKDRYDLTRPEAQETDLNTWYAFITKPETLTLDNVRKAFNTGKLTKGDFKAFTVRAMELQKDQDEYVQNVDSINNRIKVFADQAGLKVYEAEGPEEKRDMGNLLFRIQTDINRVKAQNKGKVTMDEADKIIKRSLVEYQLQGGHRAWYNPARWFGSENDPDYTKRAYQLQPGDVINVPDDARKKIIASAQQNGVPNPTEEQIRNAYFAMTMEGAQ